MVRNSSAADGNEADQGRKAPLVDRQPLGGEHAVVQQAVEVEGPHAVARHVGVAEHEVHVVDGVQAAEQAAEEAEPVRAIALRGRLLGRVIRKAMCSGSSVSSSSQPAIGVAADAAAPGRPARGG